jgi:outer membrane murein-binding lipoprotein Lpp
MAVSAKKVTSRIFTSLLVVSLVAGCVVAYLHKQQINDHFAAQRFEPTAQIVTLTDDLRLTEAGHRIFWASTPTLDASQNFNTQCAGVDHSEEGHILGCYTAGSIHLFEINDERLNGIVEVTAAHELLHATFARLSDGERSSLVKKLNALYDEMSPNDPELRQRMEVYSGLSKTAFANELHSVLGTERRDLPEWLERHYETWFTERGIILDFFDSYHAVFSQLRQRADELEAAMTALRSDVEARSADYDAEVERFNREWAAFVARNDAFEFSGNPEEFYLLRDDFYSRRDALGEMMRGLNADIERYEQMRTELLELSELNHELERQLDSELAPPAPAPTGEV